MLADRLPLPHGAVCQWGDAYCAVRAHRLEADCQFLQKHPQTVATAKWCCLSVEWHLLHWHEQCFSK
eukprot:14883865-Ditylum_brightwellii.AAC.1